MMQKWEDISIKERIKQDIRVYVIICIIVVLCLSPLIYIIIKHATGLSSLIPIATIFSILLAFLMIAIMVSIMKNRPGGFTDLRIQNGSFRFIDANGLERCKVELKDIDSIHVHKGSGIIFIAENPETNQKIMRIYADIVPQYADTNALFQAASQAMDESLFRKISRCARYSTRVRNIAGLEKYLDSLNLLKETDWNFVFSGHPLIIYKR